MMRGAMQTSKYDSSLKIRRKSVLNQPETGNWGVFNAYFDEETKIYNGSLFRAEFI